MRTTGSYLTATLRATNLEVHLDHNRKVRLTNESTTFRTPDDWVKMARFSKKASGRELSEVVWDKYP